MIADWCILKDLANDEPLNPTIKVKLLRVFAEVKNLQEVIDSPSPQPSKLLQYDQALINFNARIKRLYLDIQDAFNRFGFKNNLSFDDLEADDPEPSDE